MLLSSPHGQIMSRQMLPECLVPGELPGKPREPFLVSIRLMVLNPALP